MKLSLPLLIVALLASLGAAEIEARGSTTACNADNCLRALRNPTRTAAATSFCHSYTQSHITATTSLPAQFATQCGSGPTQSARLSSACSCYVPPAATTCGDTTSDNNNCGACGNVCASGTTCKSGACAPPAGTCPSYTASCSSVVNGLLASNSIASPQLVDYRIQSAVLGITSPSAFLAALGSNPCHIYTDPTENSVCMALLANSQFVAQLTDIITGELSAFQTCASDFAAGEPDYQIIINEPNNTNCMRRAKRTFGVREDYDMTLSMLEGLEFSRSIAGAPLLGPRKSSGLQLTRKQLSTCAQTGMCFDTCPDCRDQQTYGCVGSQASVITGAVCGTLGTVAGGAAAFLSFSACTAACAELGPLALACGASCSTLAAGFAGVAVGAACAEVWAQICDPITQRCANCNTAHNGICNADSTQCCAGETGTNCGANCCCCPECFAPGGINCECTAAPC